jgi:peptide/nickel transport system substrate-binding protein
MPAEGSVNEGAPGPTAPRGKLTRRAVLQRGAAAGAALGAGSFLTACLGDDDDSASSGSSGPANKGGTLRVGLPAGGPSDTINALTPILLTDFARANNLFDNALDVDANTQEIVPKLIEEFEPNSDATEWTFRLRKGVEWHDGKPLSADDLIYTIKAILDPETGSPFAAYIPSVDPKRLKKVDAHTVRIGLVQPFLLPFAFTSIFIVPDGFDPKNPIGTGPFKYKSFTPGKQSVFTANPNYWDEGPFVDELVLIDLTDDTARLNAQMGGQTDLMAGVPYANAQTIESAGGMKLVEMPNDGFLPFVMNCTEAPFDDVRVRQAVRLLADRDQMVEAALSGYGKVGNDLYCPGDPLYDDSIEQREQDLEQAKSLLRQAGHLDTPLVFNAVPLATGCLESAQVLAENAKAAGVNMQVKRIDVGTFTSKFGTWPLVSSQWPGIPWILQLIASDAPKGAYPETKFGDVDKEFAKLASQVVGELDEGRRKEIADEMQRIEWDRGGFVIWGFSALLGAATDKVTGYVTDKAQWDFGDFAFRKVSFT